MQKVALFDPESATLDLLTFSILQKKRNESFFITFVLIIGEICFLRT